jgi:hypothetical protein
MILDLLIVKIAKILSNTKVAWPIWPLLADLTGFVRFCPEGNEERVDEFTG